MKRRPFTGVLGRAVLKELSPGTALSKRELLGRLRAQPKLALSQSKLTAALGDLLAGGYVEMSGSRATARFRRV